MEEVELVPDASARRWGAELQHWGAGRGHTDQRLIDSSHAGSKARLGAAGGSTRHLLRRLSKRLEAEMMESKLSASSLLENSSLMFSAKAWKKTLQLESETPPLSLRRCWGETRWTHTHTHTHTCNVMNKGHKRHESWPSRDNTSYNFKTYCILKTHRRLVQSCMYFIILMTWLNLISSLKMFKT